MTLLTISTLHAIPSYPTCDPLGDVHLNCLLYADDIILMSISPIGLQNCSITTYNYCCKWGLDINYDKAKVMVFNKAGRLYNHKSNVDNQCGNINT